MELFVILHFRAFIYLYHFANADTIYQFPVEARVTDMVDTTLKRYRLPMVRRLRFTVWRYALICKSWAFVSLSVMIGKM